MRNLVFFFLLAGCSLSELDRFYLAPDAAPTPDACMRNDVETCRGKCDQLTDNCGFIVQCGGCPQGQSCGAAGANTCGVTVCGSLGQNCCSTGAECAAP